LLAAKQNASVMRWLFKRRSEQPSSKPPASTTLAGASGLANFFQGNKHRAVVL
jgi:hypothetical protein